MALAIPVNGAEHVPDSAVTLLKELQVTAKGNNKNLESVSPAVTLDADRLLTGGVTDISDAMRRLPGVNLRDYGGSGGMKTISVRGLGTQHTGVIYDGASLSDVQGGQIDLSRYSLHNLSSITLNIGDADDIYIPARGMSTSSSLVISSLRDPDLMSGRPEIAASVRAASFGTINPYMRLELSNGNEIESGNLGMCVTGEYLHARNNYPFTLVNGKEKSRERRDNSQINSGHAEWNGIWKPTISSKLQAKAYWYQTSRHLPGPVIYYNSVSHQRLHERNGFGQISYSCRISGNISLKALAKFNHSFTRYTDKDGRYQDGILDQRYTQNEEYVTAALLWRATKNLQASYAADFWHNSLRSNMKTDSSPFRNSLLQAFCVKWNIRRLTVTARGLLSIIHDKSQTLYEGKTEKRLSPSVGISLQPIDNVNWRIRTSYKDIFRMPTFNELYFDHYGSVNLDPEKTKQWNIGTTFGYTSSEWFSGITVTADGYYNLVRNKIVAMPYNAFVMTMTNLGKVRALGFDATLEAEFRPADEHSIRINMNYSYQRAAPRTDRTMTDWNKQVAYTPLNSGAGSVTWSNPWVNMAAHGSGCSSRYPNSTNVPGTRIVGYAEFGLTLFREFRFGRNVVEVRADAINLLDKQYEIITRYPMPGRSFSITLGYKLR